MTPPLPKSWRPVLADEMEKPYFEKLEAFLAEERAKHTVFPPEPEVFTALKLTPSPPNALVTLKPTAPARRWGTPLRSRRSRPFTASRDRRDRCAR